MFTGIIKASGQVESIYPKDVGFELTIQAPQDFVGELSQQSNVAIDGRVFTVSSDEATFEASMIQFFLSHIKIPEQFKPGRRINLERSLRLGEEVPSFLFSGIPSGQGKIASLETITPERIKLEVLWNDNLLEYLDLGDQVCIDGVLLRIKALRKSSLIFELYHPDALSITNLTDRKIGDWVNIEIDPITKKISQIIDRKYSHRTKW